MGKSVLQRSNLCEVAAVLLPMLQQMSKEWRAGPVVFVEGRRYHRSMNCEPFAIRYHVAMQRGVCIAALAALALAACSRDEGASEPANKPIASPQPAVAGPAPDKAVVEARLKECSAALKAALEPGLLNNASFDNGRPILWVGPAWKQTTPAIRHSLARNAACFFRSGDESRPIRYSVYDQATDREIAIWDYTHLLIL